MGRMSKLWLCVLGVAWVAGAVGCVPIDLGSVKALSPSAVLQTVWVDVAAPQDRQPVSLRWESERRVSGFAGCNRYTSEVVLGAQGISFKGTATTRMQCEPEAMDTEQRYTQALDKTRSARIDKGVLELLGEQGQILWRFKPLV